MGIKNMETIVIETVQYIRRRNEYHNRAMWRKYSNGDNIGTPIHHHIGIAEQAATLSAVVPNSKTFSTKLDSTLARSGIPL